MDLNSYGSSPEELDRFKRDALKDLGLQHHPKREKIYALAWEKGHGDGHAEIYSHLVDLSTLFEEEGQNNHRLAHDLRAGRGGPHYRSVINTIFGKLTRREADVLWELFQNHKADAERQGGRRAVRDPFRYR